MKPLLVIAGAGQTGRELAARLLSNWRIALIDPDPQKLALLEQEGPVSEVLRIRGDATSALVLKESEIESAHAALAVTGRDDVNLEFCRLARDQFGVPEVLSVVNVRPNLPRFEELGVTPLSRPFAIASVLQSRLERGRRTTADVGLGQGELLEVTVLPHSPVIGKTLADLHPQSWLVGALYRKGRLVVPHGSTRIEEGDRVLLVGQPDILPPIADYFRSGTSEFPLQYGSRIVVAIPEAADAGHAVEEGFALAQSTRAFGVTFLGCRDPEGGLASRCAETELDCAILPNCNTRLVHEQDCGCLVVPAPPVGLLDRMGMGNGRLLRFVESVRYPCLISRGTHPYRRILLVASPGRGPAHAVDLALEVARSQDSSVTAVAALPPAFVAGEEQNEEVVQSVHRAVNVGALYSLKVAAVTLEGNPVHQILAHAADFDLLVLAHRRRTRFSLTRPDVSRHLMLRAPCSVLVLSYEDRPGGS